MAQDLGYTQLLRVFVSLSPSEKRAKLEEFKTSNPSLHASLLSLGSRGWHNDPTFIHRNLSTLFHEQDEGFQDLSGQLLDKYLILEKVSSGGMGVVYKGIREDIQQTVAIKFVLPSVAFNSDRNTLLAEAKILARLSHSSVAKVITYGEFRDTIYFVTEYVPGTSIDKYCSSKELPLTEILKLTINLLRALEYVHQNKVIHADLKPSNVLVDDNNEIKLIDFGVSIRNEIDSELMPNKVFGFSPQFASPEQIANQQITTVSDIYSVGKTLKSILGDDSMLSQEQNAVIDKACMDDPMNRYQTVRELSDDIEAILASKPVTPLMNDMLYVVKKSLKRHSAIYFTVAIFLIISMMFVTQLQISKNDAIKERNIARQSGNFIFEVLETSVPMNESGTKFTAKEMLIKASEELQKNPFEDMETSVLLLSKILRGFTSISAASEGTKIADKLVTQISNEISPTTLNFAYTNLAFHKVRLREYDQALDYIMQASEQDALEYPAFPQYVIEYMKGTIHLQKTNLKSAKQFLNLGLSLNPDHQYKAHIFTDLGDIAYMENNYQESIDFFFKAIKSAENLPNKQALLGILYSSLGSSYAYLKEKDLATKYTQMALPLQKEVYGEKSNEYAAALNNAGMFYREIGAPQKAVETFTQLIPLIEELFGTPSPISAVVTLNLCQSQFANKQYDLAINSCSVAIEHYKNTAPEDMYLPISHSNLAKAYWGLENYSEALVQLDLAIQISERLVEEDKEHLYMFRDKVQAKIREMEREL